MKRKNNIIAKEPKGWNKPLTKQGKIKFAIISSVTIILLFVIGLYSLGNYKSNMQGYPDINSLFNDYFSNVNENDTVNINNCLHIRTISYKKDSQIHSNYIKQLKSENITIDVESMKIEEITHPDLQALEDEIRLEPINDAKVCNVFVNMTMYDAESDLTYHSDCYYQAVCYNALDKWYLWSLNEQDNILKKATKSDGTDISLIELIYTGAETKIGNDYTGYMYLPSSWTPNSTLPNENVKSTVMYTNPDMTARYTLAAYESDVDATTFAQNLYTTLMNDDQNKNLVIMNSYCGEYPAIKISYTESTSGSNAMIWLFDVTSHDEYIHCVTLEYAADQNMARYYTMGFGF